MKPTPKKVIVSTIGRDYKTQKLRPPQFEDATCSDVSYGDLSDILNGTLPKVEVREENPFKTPFWEAVKRIIPNKIAELVTAQ